MSRYEWEAGNIVIPSAHWKPFKDGLQRAWNEHIGRLQEVAGLTYETLKARGENAPREGVLAAEAMTLARRMGYPICDEDSYDIASRITHPGSGRLMAPKKGAFKPANTATRSYAFADAVVHLNFKERSVRWRVEENNHAVSRSREHVMGIALFRGLDAIGQQNGWTAKSGGRIVGCNEYEIEEPWVSGAGPSERASYGVQSNAENQPKVDWSRGYGQLVR